MNTWKKKDTRLLTKGMMGEDGKPDMSKMGGLFGGGGGMPSTDTSSAEEVD